MKTKLAQINAIVGLYDIVQNTRYEMNGFVYSSFGANSREDAVLYNTYSQNVLNNISHIFNMVLDCREKFAKTNED